MYNFTTLVKYEYQKLLKRRIVWVSFSVFLLLILVSVCLPLFTNSVTYENGMTYREGDLLKEKNAASQSLSGTPIDDALLDEMKKSDEIEVNSDADYVERTKYNSLLTFITGITDKGTLVTTDELYTLRWKAVQNSWEQNVLTTEEKAYLTELEGEIDTPFVYAYTMAYQKFFAYIYIVSIAQTLFFAICIPSVFTEEYVRKMHPLIQSSCLGKIPLYTAKIFTALTFSLLAGILFLLSVLLPCLLLYTASGFDAPLQLLGVNMSWALTVGQAALLLICLSLAAAILQCCVCIFLAEWTKNSVAAMSIPVGFLLFSSLLHIPEQYRVLSQIWEYLPSNLVSFRGAFSNRMVPFFGGFLKAWEAAPLCYLVFSILCVCMGYRLYARLPDRKRIWRRKV